jgi:GR25 family glycosyltransferase involved in LPS biosynthesis
MNVRNVLQNRKVLKITKTEVKHGNWKSTCVLQFIMVISMLTLFYIHGKFTPSWVLKSFSSPFIAQIKLYEPAAAVPPSHDLPVYYINLESDNSRRYRMQNQLKRLGFTDRTRVEAWNAKDVRENVHLEITSVQNMLHHNDNEIACIASHLWAMYLAVHDSSNTSPYAMIIEDDVKFEFALNWNELIERAPKDFGILQLSTSNHEQSSVLWEDYRKLTEPIPVSTFLRGSLDERNDDISSLLSNLQWSQRSWDSQLWSTHGYIINKDRVRGIIDQFVQYNPNREKFEITLKPLSIISCNQRPCIMPFRIVADIYLYALFQPTYISRIPLLNGEIVKDKGALTDFAEISSIQDAEKAKQHLYSFEEISKIIQRIKQTSSHLLPNYFLHSLYSRNYKLVQNGIRQKRNVLG